MIDLIKLLKALAKSYADSEHSEDETVFYEAADLIEQQQKRIAELKEQQHKTERLLRSSIDVEANKAVSVVGAVQNYISEVEKERDELAATVERLLVFDMTPGEYRRMTNSERYKQNLNAVRREVYADGFYDGYVAAWDADHSCQQDHNDYGLEQSEIEADKRYPIRRKYDS